MSINDYIKITKDLNFLEIKAIKKDFKRESFIVRGIINRRDVLLKILSKENKERINSLNKEYLVDKCIGKHNDDLNKPMILRARVLDIGENDKYCWLIRRYYSGNSLANYYPNKGKPLLGYDIIRNKFHFSRKKIIQQIVENESSLAKMTKDFRTLGIKKESIIKRFPEQIDNKFCDRINDLLSVNISKTIDFFNINKKRYFEKENTVACVGDLVPANIIITNNCSVMFSDFEWFCFDNYTIDFAFLWLFFRRYRNWQKYFVKSAVVNEKDREYFRLSVIRCIIYWYTNAMSEKRENVLKENVKYYKKHIWTRYLIAAGESFEALMKVK